MNFCYYTIIFVTKTICFIFQRKQVKLERLEEARKSECNKNLMLKTADIQIENDVCSLHLKYQPNPGLPSTHHRRVACSFRDQSLFQIFQISLTSLGQLKSDGIVLNFILLFWLFIMTSLSLTFGHLFLFLYFSLFWCFFVDNVWCDAFALCNSQLLVACKN